MSTGNLQNNFSYICSNSGAGVLLFVKPDHLHDVYAKGFSCGVITLSKPANMQVVAQNLRLLCTGWRQSRRRWKKSWREFALSTEPNGF